MCCIIIFLFRCQISIEADALCKNISFANIFFFGARYPLKQIICYVETFCCANIFVVPILLLCKYICCVYLYCCCANICFYWRQIPIEADALLCAPRNLFVQTPLTRHRHTPFHIRQPFQNIQHAVERSVFFQIFIGPKSDRCLS